MCRYLKHTHQQTAYEIRTHPISTILPISVESLHISLHIFGINRHVPRISATATWTITVLQQHARLAMGTILQCHQAVRCCCFEDQGCSFVYSINRNVHSHPLHILSHPLTHFTSLHFTPYRSLYPFPSCKPFLAKDESSNTYPQNHLMYISSQTPVTHSHKLLRLCIDQSLKSSQVKMKEHRFFKSCV